MDLLNQFVLSHIDFGTISILFCLMAVVAGFTELGYMDALAEGLVKRAKTQRMLLLSLTMACFLISMFVTNDVALIVMVPFTMRILKSIGCEHKLIKAVVLETIGANLGSMLTPIGNPQNVYLYQTYKMNLGGFFGAVWYFALASAILLVVIWLLDRDGKAQVILNNSSKGQFMESERKRKVLYTALYGILFLVCLLTVLNILPFYWSLIITVVGIGVSNFGLFRQVDYGLLIKFVMLFIVVGNLSNIPVIRNNLDTFVSGNEFFAGIGLSQCFSNVPAAILLSGFTTNGTALLQGVNVGGLGTLIASMASMISLEAYGKGEGARKKAYIAQFTGYNLLFLAVLVILWVVVESG